jgi:hypothetical protein
MAQAILTAIVFGAYTSLLTRPRVTQFALGSEF